MKGRHVLAILLLLLLPGCLSSPLTEYTPFAIRLVHPRNHVLVHHRVSRDAIAVSGYAPMPRHPAANTNLTREIYWVSEAPFLTREHLNHATVAKRAAVLVMNEEQYYEFTSRMRTVNPDTPIVPYLTYRARIEEAVAEIRLEFTREGSELLSQFTRRHRLRRMAITVDDQVLSTPIINEHIKTGTMILSSGYSRESGKRVVRQMLRK